MCPELFSCSPFHAYTCTPPIYSCIPLPLAYLPIIQCSVVFITCISFPRQHWLGMHSWACCYHGGQECCHCAQPHACPSSMMLDSWEHRCREVAWEIDSEGGTRSPGPRQEPPFISAMLSAKVACLPLTLLPKLNRGLNVQIPTSGCFHTCKIMQFQSI